MSSDSRDRHLERKRREQAARRERAADRQRRNNERPGKFPVGPRLGPAAPRVPPRRGSIAPVQETPESRRVRSESERVRAELREFELEWLAFGHDTSGRFDLTLVYVGRALILLGRLIDGWADRPLRAPEVALRASQVRSVRIKIRSMSRRLDDAHAAEVVIGAATEKIDRSDLAGLRQRRAADLINDRVHVERAVAAHVPLRELLRRELIGKLGRRRAKREFRGGPSDVNSWRWDGGG